MHYRASVSNLEAYRRYCASDSTDLYDFAKSLVMPMPQNDEMVVGTTIHTALEHGFYHDILYTPTGIRIFTDPINETIYAPNTEVYTQWVSDCGLTLTGRADAIDFQTVWDHKVTGGAGGYYDSLQWRAYLTIFKCDRFIYNIFKRSPINSDQTGKYCRIIGFSTEEYTVYSGMHQEVQDACRDYMIHVAPLVSDIKKERSNYGYR